MSGHSVSKTEIISTSDEQFAYDYDTLRTTGLILSVVMFVVGIVVALSKKFKCAKSTSGPKSGETQTATA